MTQTETRHTEQHTWTICTDGFLAGDIVTDSLDEAIKKAFAGNGLRVYDERSLYRVFDRLGADGAWCWIECDGERVLEIGTP